ncbi:YdeI/OmpD-associated family protein [Microcella daejeonensis]|uniref:YdeI/OmpD-associated family protein n=1 Tax=Microcella daejeonensis TaxID=2994971 RepID=A0A9E8SC13_9MICO|nr:YdeI/OmpD-associated family protein [Microcella daejeonensis]WAB82102.1 YdeI/OmpD-associated family protein [Microcella daejeonensis]
MIGSDRFPHVEVASAAELRAWLERHHAQEEAVWLVTFKKAVPAKYLSTAEVLDELVAFGWIDGIRRAVDDERTMQLISPRRTQPWAKTYTDRAERLIAEGRMAPAGLASVEAARRSGAWEAMADVDALVVPDDLRRALDAAPPALTVYEAFPPSVRRNILRWIASAKTPPTREKRIALTTAEARAGRRVKSNG